MDFLKILKTDLKTHKKIVLNVKVTPGAPNNEIFDQLSDGTLKVRLQTAPENGKANKALIKLLQKEFSAEVVILSGETSSRKRIQMNLFLQK